jgi:hypothetical protein
VSFTLFPVKSLVVLFCMLLSIVIISPLNMRPVGGGITFGIACVTLIKQADTM